MAGWVVLNMLRLIEAEEDERRRVARRNRERTYIMPMATSSATMSSSSLGTSRVQ